MPIMIITLSAALSLGYISRQDALYVQHERYMCYKCTFYVHKYLFITIIYELYFHKFVFFVA